MQFYALTFINACYGGTGEAFLSLLKSLHEILIFFPRYGQNCTNCSVSHIKWLVHIVSSGFWLVRHSTLALKRFYEMNLMKAKLVQTKNTAPQHQMSPWWTSMKMLTNISPVISIIGSTHHPQATWNQFSDATENVSCLSYSGWAWPSLLLCQIFLADSSPC